MEDNHTDWFKVVTNIGTFTASYDIEQAQEDQHVEYLLADEYHSFDPSIGDQIMLQVFQDILDSGTFDAIYAVVVPDEFLSLFYKQYPRFDILSGGEL